MIAPTVGRVVWYWSSYPTSEHHQPCAAIIAFVHNDRRVNLSVIDHDGLQWSAKDVLLSQGDVPVKLTGPFCQWMPHQVGQAKKDEKAQFLNPSLGEPFADTKNGKPTVIHLTPHEIQSGSTRVDWAEGLIRQLPETHEGRNSWLLNYASDADARRAEWSRRNGRGFSPLPDDGTDAAVALCRHLDRVGRTSSERTVTIDGGTFNVKAKLVYRPPAETETKTYADGTTATGPSPLPDASPRGAGDGDSGKYPA